MRMTPALTVVGSVLVFWASIFIVVILPSVTMHDRPSDISRDWTPAEDAGHSLYVQNGCSYCHSLYVRVIDWDLGADRIAQSGDYYAQNPAILGTERTGPDLSQAGGEHPDDWHWAHFTNPRNTRPLSLMPSWEFLGPQALTNLTAYVQSLSGRAADFRVDRQRTWKTAATQAYASGVDRNIDWLHAQVPAGWRSMPNPYPATPGALERGRKIYAGFCMNCHGPVGDGQGTAERYLSPPPLNFTTLRRHLVDGKYIGGIFYYQVMNGITGTGMPYFKRELESEKIWDVSNYVAVNFLGYTDAGIAPRGIAAAYESNWTNTFRAPVTGE